MTTKAFLTRRSAFKQVNAEEELRSDKDIKNSSKSKQRANEHEAKHPEGVDTLNREEHPVGGCDHVPERDRSVT